MKLGLLIAVERDLDNIVSKVEIDGVRAYRLRKALGDINDELKAYQDMRNEFINKHSDDNRLIPGRDDEALAELNATIVSLMNEEVDIKISPILHVEDFTKISISTLTLLEELGILAKLEDEKKPASPKKHTGPKKVNGKK